MNINRLFSNLLRKTSKVFSVPIEYFQDLILFAIFNHNSPFAAKANKISYKLIIHAHAIEKGLSLPNPRPMFGRFHIETICSLVDTYDCSCDPFPVAMALGSLEEYIRFNIESGHNPQDLIDLDKYVKTKLQEWRIAPSGGTKLITKTRLELAKDSKQYNEFLTSRFSCRFFSDEKISDEVIANIIKVATSAPSQCNRQSTRLHYFRDPLKISQLLSLQGGSRGFSDNVPNLLIASFDLTGWANASQRNQGYVDAALLSMVIMYAFHSMGVASCPLNLALTNADERTIRSCAGIPAHERLVMMIAFGYPSKECSRSARSERISVKTLLSFHD